MVRAEVVNITDLNRKMEGYLYMDLLAPLRDRLVRGKTAKAAVVIDTGEVCKTTSSLLMEEAREMGRKGGFVFNPDRLSVSEVVGLEALIGLGHNANKVVRFYPAVDGRTEKGILILVRTVKKGQTITRRDMEEHLLGSVARVNRRISEIEG